MSQLSAALLPDIKSWTKEDVHRWLMTEVKVHQSWADKFIEEDVSGEVLHDIEKKDILFFGIKHGPAVKITFYLENLKTGSQHQSQFPADVENWTKEQVSQWLQQCAKIDSKKAKRFQKHDVSGDCLVCFKKQDFLDLKLKKGPAIKTLKELDRLKNRATLREGIMQSFVLESQKEDYSNKRLPLEKTLEQDPLTASQERKETAVNPAPVIKNTLDKLGTADLKEFIFRLRHYTDSDYEPIPWGRLEDKDTIDIATLVTNHYECEKALCVTRDILLNINQRELVAQLENHMGQVKLRRCIDEEEDTEDTEDTVKSKSSSCSRSKHQKRGTRKFLCFMNIKTCCKS